MAAIGHLHGHGVAIEATKREPGRRVYLQVGGHARPLDVHSVMSMSTCTGDPVATIRQGDLVRLHNMYQSSHPATDVMGIIMLLYVDRA